MATNQQQSAIPLVLPNNCTWDAETGTYDKKEGVGRETLNAIPKALDQLREIKGPVCVVSIAGPCRMGKSYILGKAFADQEVIFPLGHFLDPETMGIWLWIVPQKFNDSTGREFTVVLLDSEGIGSVYAKQADDHRIFTLSVLLSSILMYNSGGVPKKGDLEGLDFIVKLSQRIKLRSTQKNPTDKDESHFHESFPYFIWLLRDVVLSIPPEYSNLKDYLVEKVFGAKSGDSSEGDKKTAKSILRYFSGFDAFKFPPPACDPEVVQNLYQRESEGNPRFFKEIGFFKEKLYSILAPKKSINEGEFVTGEALAAMVLLYVQALNTPGTVPNVQNTWDTFVLNKCTEVLAAALAAYKQNMESQMKDKIPCEANVIRAAHQKVLEERLTFFRQETLNLSSASVENHLNQLISKIKNFLTSILEKNEGETDKQCTSLLRELKKSILDPVFTRLRDPEGSSMDFKEIVGAYNKMEKAYFEKARGDHNIRAVVFVRFSQDFKEEMDRNIDLLQKMKDYDAAVVTEKTKSANLEQKRLMDEEQNKRLVEERKTREKELDILEKKYKKDTELLEKAIKENRDAHEKQMKDLKKACLDEVAKEREAMYTRQLEAQVQQLKHQLEEAKKIQDQVQQLEQERDEAKKRTRLQNFLGVFTGK